MSDRQKAIQAIEDGVADPEDFGAALLGLSEEAPPMPDSTLPTWEDSVRAAGLGPRLAQALRIPAIRGHVRAGAAGHAVSAICEAFPDIAAALATTPPLDVETLAEALYWTLAEVPTDWHGEGEQRVYLRHARTILARLSKSPPEPR